MKKYFITGLIILLPLAFTLMIFVFIVDLFTSPFLNIFTSFLSKFENTLTILQNPALLKFFARILIIGLLCIFIFLLGIVGRGVIFNYFLHIANKIVCKIPFVKTIYKSLKDIISALISPTRKAFNKTTMVPFFSNDVYCVGFESGSIPQECLDKTKIDLQPVFMPTAPHPISGYLVLVPKKESLDVNISNEDSVRFTVSCGLILPGEKLQDVTKK